MIVFRRGQPPDKYHQVKDDGLGKHHHDPLPPHNSSDQKYIDSSKPAYSDRKRSWGQKNRIFLSKNQQTEQKVVERKPKNGLPRVLLRPLSFTGNKKLNEKRNKNKAPSDVHDLDGDAATAGSSQVSAGGYHSLPGASQWSSTTHEKEEETRSIPMIRPRHSSSKLVRNTYACTDMTGISMVPRGRDHASHHAFRKYHQGPQSLLPHHAPQEQQEPNPKPHRAPAHVKDNFASLVKSKAKCSNSRIGFAMEEAGDLPSPSTKKVHKATSSSCDSSFVHTREQSVPPLAQKEDQGTELETMKAPNVEAGDLPRLTISVGTKRKLRMEEQHNDAEVGDLPPLTIRVWAKQRLKLLSTRMEDNFGTDITSSSTGTSDTEEEFPSDETAEMVPRLSLISDRQDQQPQDSEDCPFDCYIPLAAHPPQEVIVEDTSFSRTGDNFGTNITCRRTSDPEEQYPFDETSERVPVLSSIRDLQDQLPEDGEDCPFDCYCDLKAASPLAAQQQQVVVEDTLFRTEDKEEFPSDETAEKVPAELSSIRALQEQQAEDGEDCPFDCNYNLDGSLSLAAHPQLQVVVEDTLFRTQQLKEEYPLDETTEMVPSRSSIRDLQEQQPQDEEDCPFDCNSCNLDGSLSLATHPQQQQQQHKQQAVVEDTSFGGTEDNFETDTTSNSSTIDTEEDYPLDESAAAEMVPEQRPQDGEEDCPFDCNNCNQDAALSLPSHPQQQQVQPADTFLIMKLSSSNIFHDCWFIPKDDGVNSDISDQETLSQDPEECPMSISPVEEKEDETKQAETTTNGNGDDDDLEEERHRAVKEGNPWDEEEDTNKKLIETVQKRRTSILDSALKFMDAFTTTNQDDFHYDTCHITKMYGI